jgi:hypothetical protein
VPVSYRFLDEFKLASGEEGKIEGYELRVGIVCDKMGV